MSKHTETPWEFDHEDIFESPSGEIVARKYSSNSVNWEANAAFIVRAVNAHERLVRALELAESYLVERGIEHEGNTGRTIVLPAIRAALSAAKE